MKYLHANIISSVCHTYILIWFNWYVSGLNSYMLAYIVHMLIFFCNMQLIIYFICSSVMCLKFSGCCLLIQRLENWTDWGESLPCCKRNWCSVSLTGSLYGLCGSVSRLPVPTSRRPSALPCRSELCFGPLAPYSVNFHCQLTQCHRHDSDRSHGM